ncbi:MAG TPA: S-layer homology domain-containing protein [Bacillota bacterium]|nr:S-layer homology domain-containing protein [Bacillota bacterium]
MKKKLLKTIALALALSLTATTAVFAAVPADVKGQSYEEAVTALVEKGIITGDTDGSFHPDSELTRAQACIIIVKSMNAPAVEVTGSATQSVPGSGFSDMSGYGWAEGYISYAVKNDVVKGYPDGTFKPGSKVTMNELATMVLRAAGYSDKNLSGTWPSNYVAKAAELDLLKNIPAPMPELATKWMAAQMDYNALEKIAAANPEPSAPSQGTDEDKAKDVPDTANMKFMTGTFNETMTSFSGNEIAKNAILYTYGKSKDYSSTMTFSAKAADYRLDTVYKFKNVETPAFYRLENNKITEMVIPTDVGYSGRAYGVINEVSTTVNGDGDSVTALETLTATREITWLSKSGFKDVPAASGANGYEKGTVFEILVSNGTIKQVTTAADSGKKNGDFKELSGSGFVKVKSFDDNVIETVDGDLIPVKDNASVYVMDEDKDPIYSTGSLSRITEGMQVRAYDVLDDDEETADVIVVMK